MMWNTTARTLANSLDKCLAIGGVVLALVLVFLPGATIQRLLVAFSLLLVCSAYLVLRIRESSLELLKQHKKRSVFLGIDVVFIILFVYSIFSLILRADPYVRPVGYFIAVACATGIIALEAVLFPRKITLAKIVLVALSLRLTPQLIFPDLVGIDPYVHQTFTASILRNGYIPQGFGYSNMPIMHLIIGLTSAITGLDYRASTMISITFYQTIGLVFVFLFSKSVFNEKVGLIAALLLGIADTNIEMGFWVRPVTLGLILVPFLMYLILKVKDSFVFNFLVLLICAELILTHTIASLLMALLLFSFWVGSKLYRKLYTDRSRTVFVSLFFAIFFSSAMLSWWTYASGNLPFLAEIIKSGFRLERWETAGTTLLYVKGYELENALNITGTILYYSFVIIGSLYMLGKRFRREDRFAFTVASFLPLAIAFSSLELGMSGLLASRWLPSAQLITAPLAAAGLILSVGSFKKDLVKVSALVILVIVISFFMITKPGANIDNPIYSKNTMIRFAFTDSELKAGYNILNTYVGELRVDSYYEVWFEQKADKNVSLVDLTPQLVSGNYTGTKGLIVIRDEIVKEPFYIANGIYRLNYDPNAELDNPRFDLVYDSQAVHAYWGR
jgi:hypothetical protein